MQLHHGPFNKPYKFLKATRYTMGGSYHSYLHQKLLSGQKMLKKVHKMQKKNYNIWTMEEDGDDIPTTNLFDKC